MSDVMVGVDGVAKKFCRSWSHALWYRAGDAVRRALGRPPDRAPRAHEFWAVDGVSAVVRRGECLGVVGPNGAGKSTLLNLMARNCRPDRGTVHLRGRVQCLLRLGTGLQPLLTGRENVYIKCSELGLARSDAEARLAAIVDFAELQAAIDRPVRHYSDGMYARLDFAIATSGRVDVLLLDEVLAVGDIAFQRRCLDRLHALKRNGTAIVIVSHAEINIRYVADRCLLLLDGRDVAQGTPDAVLRKYHEAVGYLNGALAPGWRGDLPEDAEGPAAITALQTGAARTVAPGAALAWTLDYRIDDGEAASLALVLQFWNSAGMLVASIDSRYAGAVRFQSGIARLYISVPFLCLAPGRYRIAGGFVRGDRFVGYRNALAELQVADADYRRYGGLAVIPAEIAASPRRAD